MVLYSLYQHPKLSNYIPENILKGICSEKITEYTKTIMKYGLNNNGVYILRQDDDKYWLGFEGPYEKVATVLVKREYVDADYIIDK